MKKEMRKYLTIYWIANGIFLLLQVILTIILLTLQDKIKLAHDTISNIFFGILVFVVLCVVLYNYFGINRPNKKISKKEVLSDYEEEIGFEVMKLHPKILDEKSGYINFNNRRGYLFLLISSLNIFYSLILAIILQVI
ncbi:hypothetical protein [Spiroplasma eriocheiris]|uniref:DUF3899 domain-containing protein n=1 Tax=Spiroplasma eriocheiris TaxID=315358 RepID=A0A0H3XK94_9MOLU|nr:hypothetical protein [Spiroplasma eriocheiris]AHF57329.1 putative transmembrane protein [Spiroplasma eriocheiris CCTCC M 207170]AKM53789.1 hypothetical protein SERIO_v1c01980 [Spiroplasma eriocheiris]